MNLNGKTMVDIFNNKSVIINSKRSREDFLERLRDRCEEGFLFWDYCSNKGFNVRIKNDKFSLRKIIFFNNHFQNIFYGRISESDNGIKIEGAFKMSILGLFADAKRAARPVPIE